MSDLLQAMAALVGRNLYFYTEPYDPDFTAPSTAKAVFSTEDGSRVELPLPYDQLKFREFLVHLGVRLATGGVLMGWNVKGFLSYARNIAGSSFSFGRDVYDLKLLAGFSGLDVKPPSRYAEAQELLGRVANPAALEWHDKVYLPLAAEVLPAVESVGLIDRRTRKVVYPSYEIEASLNGRLSCPMKHRFSFNPHGLKDDDLPHMSPLGYEKVFIHLDYRHVEVSVLQWLSGDPLLTAMINSGKDLYESIWEEITGAECTPEFREECKLVFLPVVYGMGESTLAKSREWPLHIAKRVRDNVYSKFSTAMGYVMSKQKEAETGVATDHFGRRRYFPEKPYLARDFVIQSAASTICLYKLVRLHRELKDLARICYHVHDGYCIIADVACAGRVSDISREVLESPEADFPGLRLSCKTKSGRSLDSLK